MHATHSIPFVKMHGCGNDYVYIDAFSNPAILDHPNLADLARRISNRHTGIGSDGLIILCTPDDQAAADIRMRMFNADGSESEMCGNGVRCVAKFAHDRLRIAAHPMRVQTGRGVLSIRYETRDCRLVRATVAMGEPIVDPRRVPVDPSFIKAVDAPHQFELVNPSISERAWTFVSMGNPHAVAWIEESRARPCGDAANDFFASPPHPRLLETHSAFPKRANIHLASVRSRTHAAMQTWERGSGFTQACGTGACAVLVAGVLTNRLDREADIEVPGGQLHVTWDARSNIVHLAGPAVDVFEGNWIESLRDEAT